MNYILKPYEKMADFLNCQLGPDYEIAISDTVKGEVVFIKNGYISGRKIGDPLTNAAKTIIRDGLYKEQDFISNYLGLTSNGKKLRSGTLFIKNELGELCGLFCVNFSDERYANLVDHFMHICHPTEYLEEHSARNYAPSILLGEDSFNGVEEFAGSADNAVNEILRQTLATKPTQPERMTQEEKLEIVDALSSRGVFYIKGAVGKVADALHSSEATIYRYLSKLNKQS